MSNQDIRLIAESITEDPNVFSEAPDISRYMGDDPRGKAARAAQFSKYEKARADRVGQATAREKGPARRAARKAREDQTAAADQEALKVKANQAAQFIKKLQALAPRTPEDGQAFGRSIPMDTAAPVVKGIISAMKEMGLVEKVPNSWRLSEVGEAVANNKLPRGMDRDQFIAQLAELGETLTGMTRIEKDRRAQAASARQA